ncbi:TIGR01777 family oxidoreductase [Nitrospira sp. Nam80]
MRVIVTGGTGFIGRALVHELGQNGHDVTVLSRNPVAVRALLSRSVACVGWDPHSADRWQEVFEDADAVINLAGAPIAERRWTGARKRLIRESRVSATRAVVETLCNRATKACVLVNASGIGYYGASNGISIYETVGAGSGFLADLCVEWEREARRAEDSGVRVVRLRLGMVLECDGGALPKMVLPFRLFLGGHIMPGSQWVSWIHRRDVIGLIQWALENPRVSGAVNAVSPDPVTMRTFCRFLGKALNRPSWLPVPEFMVRAGLGELGSVMTTGQRVLPRVAAQGGYTFQYAALEPALRAILGRNVKQARAA